MAKRVTKKKVTTRRRVAKRKPAARTAITVTFKGSPQRYDYFVPKGMKIEEGDFAVVKSPYGGVVLTNVVDVFDGELIDNKATKEILDVVSCEPLRRQRNREARRQEIHLMLGSMLREQSDTAKYAALARKPEAKALLRELETLGG